MPSAFVQIADLEKQVAELKAELAKSKTTAAAAQVEAVKARAVATPAKLTRDQAEAQYRAIPSGTREGAKQREAFRLIHKSELGL